MTNDNYKLETLYLKRKNLLDSGYEWDSDEVCEIEDQINDIEILPDFNEVLNMISTGRMQSIFK